MSIIEQIRNLDTKNREILLKEDLLESMRASALEAVFDLQVKISQILINNSIVADKIVRIKELMNKPEIKIKIQKIMEDLGAKRLEDLSMFADTMLNIIEAGENHD